MYSQKTIKPKTITNVFVYSGFFSIDRKIKQQDIPRFVEIMLDSGSYEWGEIGTPTFQKTFIYLDKNNVAIGETIFSEDGQTRTYPSTETQAKWGMLKREYLNEILQLLSRVD